MQWKQQKCMAPSILHPRWWCQITWWKIAVWDETWYKDLRRMHDFPALLLQPQELDTLGALPALLCFYIYDTLDIHMSRVNFDVSPERIFSNISLWCNWTLESWLTSGISYIALPLDLLLIWRECVWKGIPGKAVGRPCTTGRLTLFHPNQTALIFAAQLGTAHRCLGLKTGIC